MPFRRWVVQVPFESYHDHLVNRRSPPGADSDVDHAVDSALTNLG